MGYFTHLLIYKHILCLLSKIFQSIYKIKGLKKKKKSSHHIDDTQAGSDHELAEDFEVSFLITHFILKN